MSIICGLTGGIACGKSVVSEMFFDLGAAIVDTDILSRKVVEIGQVGHSQIVQAFPFAVYNGVIDRSKLRKAVFENNALLEKLNSIMHPLIKIETLKAISKLKNDVIIVVVPLLFESGFDTVTKPNITISCNNQTRINRLIKRDNITKELAKKIMDAQWTDIEREQKADIIINNDGDLNRLASEVKRIYLSFLKDVK